MLQAIILGDVHLGKGINIGKVGIGSNLNSRVVDQANLLDWTLDQAIDCHADDIIITGDVFEEPKPHPSLIALFLSWLKRCQVHSVNVHIILGNHDLLRSGNIYTSPLDIIIEADLENVSVHKNINTIFIGTTAFTFMPFRDRKSFSVETNAEGLQLMKEAISYELAGIPQIYKKIVVGHLAIEGSIPVGDEIDDVTNELFCPLNMFNGYDYVWMGHVHKPQVMKKKSPYIAHIGSMDISNFGETDHIKNIVIIDCDSNDEFVLKEIPTRPLKKILITVPKDTEDATKYVLDEIKKSAADFDKSIIKVEVSILDPEVKSINKSSIEKFLVENGAQNVTNISESKKVSLVKKDTNNTIDTKMDPPSAIKAYANAYVEEAKRPAFIELAMDIVSQFKSETKEAKK
jgi:DNA repair exonuclease SbcCD nuclease subunit